MLIRRIVIAAVLLTLLGAACGSDNKTAAQQDASVLGVVIERSTTTTSTTSTTTAPPTTEPAPAPATRPSPPVTAPPEPVAIDVYFTPGEGETATATINGPSGEQSQSLESGGASFGELEAGTYSVIVTVEQASGDPSIDPSQYILNGNSLELAPGQHATVTCDQNGCTGVLDS